MSQEGGSLADATVALFSYGTLRLPEVQLKTFGRLLDGRVDALPGFSRTMLAIRDAAVVATSGLAEHPIVTRTDDPNDEIAGTVFWITADELEAADRYEVEDYKRVAVKLRSGIDAFVYVDARSD